MSPVLLGSLRCHCHQNHSLPTPGTAYGPQCMKTPSLAWSYQAGAGRESKEAQSGV